MSRRIVILRTLGLLLALVLLIALAGADLPSALDALRDPQRVVDTRGGDVLVLYLLQLGLIALGAWCALCVVLLAATSLRPSRRLGGVTMRLTPHCGRQLLAAALGIGTLTLTACGTPSGTSVSAPPSTTPAYVASSDAFDWALAQPGADQPSVDPSTADETGSAADDASYGGGSGVVGPTAGMHVVSPGDCLWEIATTHLGPGATTAEVAYFVDDLYQANHESIGAHPDVLPVGATLAIPSA
jgi:hypothetical protein